jgi:hypothetical protein
LPFISKHVILRQIYLGKSMASKDRKWAKSKVNTEQVKQNTKDTQQFVELTEKYKTLGSKIESKIDAIFKVLKSQFMNFDPTLTVQQELEKSAQKEAIVQLLKTAITPFKIDYEKLTNVFDGGPYEHTKASDYIKTLEESVKYMMVIAVEDFKDPLGRFEPSSTLDYLKDNYISQEKRDFITKLEKFSDASSKLPSNELFFKVVQNANILKLLAQNEVKQAIKMYLSKYNSSVDDKVKDCLKLAKTTYKAHLDALDPCKTNQLKSALAVLKNSTEITLLENWFNQVEARNLFLKTTEEFHDTYSSFLDLDNRTGVKAKDTNVNTMADFLGGSKAFDKNDKAESTAAVEGAKAESSGIFMTAWSSISSFFSHTPAKEAQKSQLKAEELKNETAANSLPAAEKGKKEIAGSQNNTAVIVVDEEEKAESSDSKEVALQNNNFPGMKYKVKKTLAIESYESQEQVHKEYQSLMQALVDAKKILCFTNVMKQIKTSSSCYIRKPFEHANSDNKLNCEAEDLKAKVGMAQCDFLFPFATDSDEVISQFLNQSSKVEVDVFDDGQTGLRSHVDTVVAEFTTALGLAVLENYKDQPVVTAQAAMALEYQKSAPQQNDGVLKIAAPDATVSATSLVEESAVVNVKVDL